MADPLPNFAGRNSTGFQKVANVFLSGEGLPFSGILSAQRIQRVFARHDCLFGLHGIYTTAVTLWSFLSQVLRDGKEASCQAAVARVVSYCQQADIESPSADTGDYCRARAKLSEDALRELSCEVASELEDTADKNWLWKGRHAKLIDGSTFTMPDTLENQAVYPQQKSQTPGVGQPIARCVAIVSLATACVIDFALGPYAGKETGESALLRQVINSLLPDDVAVMDRYYCSFMLISLLVLQRTDVCIRKHHLRSSDFRRGRRLGKYDHITVWTRPQCPEWMDQQTYDQIPRQLELREIRYTIVKPGRRTHTVDVITTLADFEQYSKAEIAELYGFRWNSELDIRSLKDSLNLWHVRCKSPAMVRRELWTTLLGYNLIRTTAAGAAMLHKKQPRQISFNSTCQYVLASWMLLACGLIDRQRVDEYRRTLFKQIAACEVGNRPDRFEPRQIKRRPKNQKLMQAQRSELKRKLRKELT